MPILKRSEETGGFRFKFHPRILGSPAPVFPGFEVDISTRVPDEQKPDAVWHRERAKQMLSDHPEIRSLFGHDPSTAAWCVLHAAAQLGLAMWAAHQPLWLLLLMAWVAGSWININLFQLAHECNHGLVFKRRDWNRWLFTFTSIPMFLPAHHTWWIEHHVHHNDLGAKKDFIKRRRSFFLLTRTLTPLLVPFSVFMLVTQVLRTAVGLATWLLATITGNTKWKRTALAVLAEEHLISGYERYNIKRWAVAYPVLWLIIIGSVVSYGTLATGWSGGAKVITYLLVSAACMTGFLSPLMFGLILSNSHFTGHTRYQPSSSYYGWLNRITFNFGLHTEHHDLEKVPWRRLPQISQIAPEYYDILADTKSYVGLALKFIFSQPDEFSRLFDEEIHRNAEIRVASEQSFSI